VNVTSTLISPFFPLQMEKQQICSLLQGSRLKRPTACLFLASTSVPNTSLNRGGSKLLSLSDFRADNIEMTLILAFVASGFLSLLVF